MVLRSYTRAATFGYRDLFRRTCPADVHLRSCDIHRRMRTGLIHSSSAMDHSVSLENTAASREIWNHQLSNEQPMTVLEGREWLRQSMQPEALRIAGVTFEGRQELIAKLQPDQALMLQKDPSNEYDPNAIKVMTLSGSVLGFVPRELTGRFLYDTTFGHAYHIGQVPDKGTWGALVAIRPQLPPLTVDAFPDSLVSKSNLSSILPESDWDKLSQATVRAASYRCEISAGQGADRAAPVVCQEVWSFDDEKGVVKLEGLQALCPEVHLAKHVLVQADDKLRQTAMWTLQAMNEWSIMEAEEYLQYIERLIQQRNKISWRLDLSWLQCRGIELPNAIRDGA
ncbi:hypothetical protein COCOBI_03-4900 [Coccomyxa sp. Obi]|nr:hypothetical protein COCOBI_03-4900 [Coccomyxa sp. Obi]